MITFTEGDIGDVIADVTMMLNAAVPEYQRLRAEFSNVTDEAIESMRQRTIHGPAVEPGEIVDPLASNFARFTLAHAAAVIHRGVLQKGKPTAQDVRRAYLGAADALATIGSILRQVKGLTYAASYVSEFNEQLVKQHKSNKAGSENRAAANEERERQANAEALAAVEGWRRKLRNPQRLAALSHADLVREYLKRGYRPDRQKRRLNALLKSGDLEK